MDTIFALATARGKAGVAIVRLSGPESHDAVRRLAGQLPPPRKAGLRTIRDHGGEKLDEALVLVFPQGESFTGEQSAELHLHGSVAVVSGVLRALGDLPGLRLAEPGEFTRRAFENGRLDLTQVEGLADLIDAETEAQRRQAERVLSGAIGQRAEQWRAALLRITALLEATIDFSEEDIPPDLLTEVRARSEDLIRDLQREVVGYAAAERVRDGFEVAIVGRPNAGKSTLLNRLAGREAAITSAVAGTTRDVIEVRMDLGGLAVTLLDTAGLRDSGDEVERIGVSRAVQRAARADLRIVLLDGHGLPPEISLLPGDIAIQGKSDLTGRPGVSGLTGDGTDVLLQQIVDVLSERSGAAGLITRERHRLALERAVDHLVEARTELSLATPRNELAAHRMRGAILALDSLVGRIDVDAMLGEIFASFCIGK
jgi:tRNA modification GTPase